MPMRSAECAYSCTQRWQAMRRRRRAHVLLSASVLMGLVALAFVLVGCSGPFGATSVPPTATTETIDVPNPSSSTFPIVTCDIALNLIAHRQVSEVDIHTDTQGNLNYIEVFEDDTVTPTEGNPGTGSHTVFWQDNTSQCESQLVAAIHQVNTGLPASQQVVLKRITDSLG